MRPKIYPSLANVSAPFKGILLDAYGVFWNENPQGLLPGSLEAMEGLVRADKIVGVLSNSTQPAFKEIQKLHKHGLVQGVHYHFFVTSGEITKQKFINEEMPFETRRKKFWLYGGIHPKFSSSLSLFEDSPYTETQIIAEADFIYISIPHINGEDQVDPRVFLDELERLKGTNLPMVCANPDCFAHEGNPPRPVVRQGSIAAMYESLGGEVFYFGKPHSIAYRAAMEQFKEHHLSDFADILMVGDTPETDIRGANDFGIPSALTTQTGIFADRVAHQGFEDAFLKLPSNDQPKFLIEKL